MFDTKYNLSARKLIKTIKKSVKKENRDSVNVVIYDESNQEEFTPSKVTIEGGKITICFK